MKRKTISLLIVIFVFYTYIGNLTNKPSTIRSIVDLQDSSDKELLDSSVSYIGHGPISINGNDDFITQNTTEPFCFQGSGTAGDPYVIYNLNISESGTNAMVNIENTDIYIILSNCLLNASSKTGIRLNNVTHIQIVNCIVSNNNENGIYMIDVDDSIVNNTICINNNAYGLESNSGGTNNTIINSILNENGFNGIHLASNDHFEIINCMCSNNKQIGINLASNANYVTIKNCSMVQNEHEGLKVSSSSYGTFVNNSFYQNDYDGMVMDSSSEFIIANNSFYQNNYDGITLLSSPDNTIANNTFEEDAFFLSVTAIDECNYTVYNNIVNGKPLLYYEDNHTIGTIPTGVGQILLVNVSNKEIKNGNYPICVAIGDNITVSDNILLNTYRTIVTTFLSNSSIHDNDLTNVGYGIIVEQAENVTVDHNSIISGIIGILYEYRSEHYIYDSILNISYNTIYNMTNDGICGTYHIKNGKIFIERNDIQNTENGINHNGYSENTTISFNYIHNCTSVGIRVRHNANNNTIINNEISNCYIGIYIYGCYSGVNYIINNTIHSCDRNGIYSESSNYVIISNNTVYNMLTQYTRAIYVKRSHWNNVSYNRVYDNFAGGIHVEDSIFNNVSFNDVNNNALGITISRTYLSPLNTSILHNDVYDNKDIGIYLAGSVNSTICNNNLTNNGFIIAASKAEDAIQGKVEGNTINGHELVYLQSCTDVNAAFTEGQVVLVNCTNVNVSGMTLSNASAGIVAVASSNLHIYDNELSFNSFCGIWLSGCLDCKISSNEIIKNGYQGMVLKNSSENEFSYNNISYNGWGRVDYYPWWAFFESAGGGIILREDSNRNNITFNVVSYNEGRTGLYTQKGTGNIITWNDFIHTNTVVVYNDILENNCYWPEHIEPDENDDGIVDTPFVYSSTVSDLTPRYNPTSGMHLISLKLTTDMDWYVSNALPKTWTLNWTCRDTKGHALTYALYFSPDAGITWTLLVEDLTTTGWTWNTTTVDNTTTCQFKIIASCSEGLTESAIYGNYTIATPLHTVSIPTIHTPTPGSTLDTYGATFKWNLSIDSWGNSVNNSLYYSIDDGATWSLIGTTAQYTNHLYVGFWDLNLPAGAVKFKVVATSIGGFSSEFIAEYTYPGTGTTPTTTPTTTESTTSSQESKTTLQSTDVPSWSFGIFTFSLLGFVVLRKVRKKRK